jgi:hypothetical protein
MVGGADRDPFGDEAGSDVRIPTAMLGEPMRDDDHPDGIERREPCPVLNAQTTDTDASALLTA